MTEPTSPSLARAPVVHEEPHSRWSLLLPLVWLALGVRVAIALVRRESVREDFLSLALVAFLMTSAVLGSRVWLWFHDHWPELRHRRSVKRTV